MAGLAGLDLSIGDGGGKSEEEKKRRKKETVSS
jgi:hypothetical protein